ncbi:hypothetical protein ISCGN_000119 [Ixodes scapularis]
MASPSPAALAPTQTVLVQPSEAYPDQGIVHNIPDANEEASVIFAEHRYMKPALQSEPMVKQNLRRAADTTLAADDQEDTASKRSRRPSTSSICTNQSAGSELRTDNIMDTGNSRAEEETNDAEHPVNWQTVVYGRRKKQEASRNLSSFLEAAAANPQLKQKKKKKVFRRCISLEGTLRSSGNTGSCGRKKFLPEARLKSQNMQAITKTIDSLQ